AQATLLIAKARILTSQRQDQPAAELVEKNLPVLLEAGSDVLREALIIYGKALDQLKQEQRMVPVVQQVLAAHPEFAEDSWVMGQLAYNLVGQGEGKGALDYAKLLWMVCPYDTDAFAAATNVLTATWMAADLNATTGNAFLTAQTDRAAPNPPTSIALPEL